MQHQPTGPLSSFLRRYFVPQIFLLLLGISALSGCLSDPVGTQVFYRGIFKPNSIARRDSNYNPTTKLGDLVVRWARSESDTQLNFKGYYIKLFHGLLDQTDTINKQVIPIGPAIDSQHLGKGFHQYIFHNLPLGYYSVAVWGERFPNPTKPDSLALSFDSAGIGFSFDPRPLLNPTNVRAVASGVTSVKITWDLPVTDTMSSVLGYVIYARKTFVTRDTSPTVDTFYFPHSNTFNVNLPSGLDIFPEAKFLFWVKTLRGDFTVGDGDTSTVEWSGAEQLPSSSDSTGSVEIVSGNGIFVGQTNQGFALLSQRNDSASIKVNISGQQVTLSGTSFVPTGDEAPKIDSIFYRTPYQYSDYSQSSIALPHTSSLGGYVVYALLPNPDDATKQRHVRLFFRVDPGTGSFVSANGSVRVRASYQPNGNLNFY